MTDTSHTTPDHLNTLIAWLNPLQLLFEDEDEEWAYYEQYEYRPHAPDNFLMGLIIAKNVFPAIYIEALTQYHQGRSEQAISQHIIACIEQRYGIPLENLAVHSTYHYGIRFPAYGIATDEAHHMADYSPAHRQVIARLCDAAGMRCVNHGHYTDGDMRLFTHDARSFDAMFYVIEDIDHISEKQYPQADILPVMRTILAYIAGVFDNPCLTITDPNQGESLWWERDHADMVRRCHEEALLVIEQITDGLDRLAADNTLLDDLCQHLQHAHHYVRTPDYHDSDEPDPDRCHPEWSGAAIGHA